VQFGSGVTAIINKFKLKFGRPQRGYRFKPGECVVNHNWAEKFRQGKSSQKQFDEMKMVIMEAGIGKETGQKATVFCMISPRQQEAAFVGKP
jgi:hypothetical protein